MGADEPRWFYIGDGQLRLKDGEAWTDEYEKIESPRARATQNAAVSEPDSGQPLAGARSRGHIALWLVVCVGLVGVGGTGAAFATGSLKLGGLTSFVSAPHFVTAGAPTQASPQTAATTASPKPSAAWNGGGYTKADYAKRVGAIPVWVRDARRDSGQAARVDLMGLGFEFGAIARMPAPPKVDPTWWVTTNSTLSKLSQKAADEWAEGDRTVAKSHLEDVVKRGNTMITRVNAAFGLRIAKSKQAS